MRALAACAVLLMACGGAPRAKPALPPVGWTVLAPAAGGFSVWVPQPYDEKLFPADVAEVVDSRAYVAAGHYIISFARFEAPIDASRERFDDLRDGFLSIPGTALESERELEVDGFPAREMIFLSAQRRDTLLVVIAGARLVQLQLTNADAATAKRFFASLRFETESESESESEIEIEK